MKGAGYVGSGSRHLQVSSIKVSREPKGCIPIMMYMAWHGMANLSKASHLIKIFTNLYLVRLDYIIWS